MSFCGDGQRSRSYFSPFLFSLAKKIHHTIAECIQRMCFLSSSGFRKHYFNLSHSKQAGVLTTLVSVTTQGHEEVSERARAAAGSSCTLTSVAGVPVVPSGLFWCLSCPGAQDHRMERVGRDLEDHLVPTPLPWAGTSSTGPGCSELHPTWPWTSSELVHKYHTQFSSDQWSSETLYFQQCGKHIYCFSDINKSASRVKWNGWL